MDGNNYADEDIQHIQSLRYFDEVFKTDLQRLGCESSCEDVCDQAHEIDAQVIQVHVGFRKEPSFVSVQFIEELLHQLKITSRDIKVLCVRAVLWRLGLVLEVARRTVEQLLLVLLGKLLLLGKL